MKTYILCSLFLFCFIIQVEAQDKKPILYGELGFMGYSDLVVLLDSDRNSPFPKTAEVGYYINRRFNVNFGWRANSFTREYDPSIMLFNDFRRQEQVGNSFYGGVEWCVINRSKIKLNLEFAHIRGGFQGEIFDLDSDREKKGLFASYQGAETGLISDAVFLFKIAGGLDVSVNMLQLDLIRVKDKYTYPSTSGGIVEESNSYDFQARFVSSVGLRYTL